MARFKDSIDHIHIHLYIFTLDTIAIRYRNQFCFVSLYIYTAIRPVLFDIYICVFPSTVDSCQLILLNVRHFDYASNAMLFENRFAFSFFLSYEKNKTVSTNRRVWTPTFDESFRN